MPFLIGPSSKSNKVYLNKVSENFLICPIFDFQKVRNAHGEKMIGWREDQLLCTFTNLDPAYVHYMQAIRIIFQFVPACVMIF